MVFSFVLRFILGRASPPCLKRLDLLSTLSARDCVGKEAEKTLKAADRIRFVIKEKIPSLLG